MRRDVRWVEKLEGAVRREVRAGVSQRGITWQFWRSDVKRWDYTTPPTAQDWAALESRMSDRYARRNAPYDDLERVRKARAIATGAGDAKG
ncbi:MAG: hypothetical protein WCL16_05365 [bacterium]